MTEVYEELRALAEANVSTEDEVSFLGAGMYDHYIPALVDSIVLRSERLRMQSGRSGVPAIWFAACSSCLLRR